MANRVVRLLTKRTSIPGKIPSGTTGSESNLIQQGELASNLYDRKLFGFDGTNIFEYGSNSFLGLTGGTINGGLTASTIYSGATNLYDIFSVSDYYTTGVTTSGNDIIFDRNDLSSAYTIDLSSTYIPYNNSILTSTTSSDRIMVVDSAGTVAATTNVIQAYIISGGTTANLLEDVNNWDINGNYTGTTITNTYQGQKHYNNNYFFEAVDDDLWIRLIRG